ncbi:MAG: preprotein translocase subunit SecE [Thermoguttaceae bacterium]|nr:preprotein translocase subunit SecE [Thermoguttaceae bacterium]
MATQPERTDGGTDKVKIICAFVAVVAGIIGYYFLIGKPTTVRLGVLGVGIVVGALLVWFSDTGRSLAAFAQESMREVRKVVWPERKEALRMTGIVFAFVLVVAMFLWGTDKVLQFVLYNIILGWKK